MPVMISEALLLYFLEKRVFKETLWYFLMCEGKEGRRKGRLGARGVAFVMQMF